MGSLTNIKPIPDQRFPFEITSTARRLRNLSNAQNTSPDAAAHAVIDIATLSAAS